jgi:flagellar assembly protein FliH
MMSTLSRPDPGEQFQQFTYPTLEVRIGPKSVEDEPLSSSPPPPSDPAEDEAARAAAFEQQAQAREAAAYTRGFAEGQQRAYAETRPALERAQTAITAAVADFARERQQYFQDVEAEVVALSLAVTRKILNRESQLDPLVLRGVVRAALERLSTGTAVSLHVPPLQAAEWRKVLDHDPLRTPVEIVEDNALGVEECRLETQLGNTHLSVEAQLKEIEQGFADLLARAPRSPA